LADDRPFSGLDIPPLAVRKTSRVHPDAQVKKPPIRKFANERRPLAAVKGIVNLKAAIGMLMSASGIGFGHIVIGPAPGGAPTFPGLLNTNQPGLNLTNHLSNTNLVLRIPQSPPETPNLKPPAAAPTSPGPGAYVTKPFTCVVIVPGAQPDDCIIPAIVPTNAIPNFKPQLKFEPLPAADGL
jgi:hypothetical protein